MLRFFVFVLQYKREHTMKNIHVRLFCMLLITCLYNSVSATKLTCFNTDLVIFSYNRPLQVSAFLESIGKYITGLSSVFVIYRADNVEFEKAYMEVQTLYPRVKFHQQTTNPHACFKPMLLDILFSKSSNPYVLFGVDDIIVTDHINIKNCIEAMEKFRAFGFYLRLGKNITSSYTASVTSYKPPLLKKVSSDLFTWRFYKAPYSWGLATSLDMTVVRKKDIKKHFSRLPYTTPNSLEIQWTHQGSRLKKANPSLHGICYSKSRIINIPLNLVQEDVTQNNMGLLSPSDLLMIFNNKLKIDITQFFRINNNAPHMEYIPTFVPDARRQHNCS